MDKMKCIDELMQNNRLLENEVATLKAELKLKDEKLSELTHGIPIEKADKKKKYHWHNGREWVVLFWNQGWKFKAIKVLPIAMNVIDDDLDRLYPLPSQTQEGS